jgi:hypothetical protein
MGTSPQISLLYKEDAWELLLISSENRGFTKTARKRGKVPLIIRIIIINNTTR